MTFDPMVYATQDMQSDPTLPDAIWIERFVAHLIKVGSPVAEDSFRAEIADYAKNIAPSYLETRKDYTDPEDAADTDISYWENEE